MSNDEQHILSLISIEIENKTKIKRFTIAFLFIVSSFLEAACFFVLKFRIFQTLHEKYEWDESDINNINTNVSIFLIYMSFLGGLFSDFLCSKFVLVFINYSALVIGSISLSLLRSNAYNNGTGILGVFCPYNESLIEKKSINCVNFSTCILFLIGFGNGIILPIFYASGCSQVKFYGVRIVSIFLFVSYATRNLAQMVSRLAISQIFSNSGFLVLFGFTFGSSFILLNTALALREDQKDKISFFSFLDVIKKLIMSALSSRYTTRRLSALDTMAFPFENKQSDLREGVKRLMCNVTLICILVLPGCVLLKMTSIINLQTFYMDVPQWIWDNFSNFSIDLMVNNLNILDESSIVIGSAVVVFILIRYFQPDQVISYQMRIILGTGLAVSSLFYSGIIESIRLNIFWGSDYDSLKHSSNVHSYIRDHKTFYAANVSLFYLCPSFIALGLSQILIQVTALEYSYLNSPPWLRYTAIGISELSWGTGSYGSRPFIYGLNGTLYNISDINYRRPCPDLNDTAAKYLVFNSDVCWHSRLDIMYYITATVMLVIFLIIIFGIRYMFPDFFRIPFWENRFNDEYCRSGSRTNINNSGYIFSNSDPNVSNNTNSFLSDDYYYGT